MSEVAWRGPGLPPLDPLEVHSGMITGPRRAPLPPPDEPLAATDARGALEELLLPAVSRPPCMVAFSGGRDSSAILSVCAHVARRHGLPAPVPITLRYEDHPRTWESEWQELMLGHLGLSDWQVLTIGTELDVLGPTAREALSRHGLYWPGNAHTTIPMLRAAGAGSLVTGNGGDETFSYLVRRVKPSVRRALRALPPRQAAFYVPLLLLPESVRTRIVYRRGIRLPWLRPGARREVVRRFLAASRAPKGAPLDELRKLHASRFIELGRGVQTAFERDTGARLFEPFLDLRFLEAAAESSPPGGFGSRAEALEAFFGDLMPPEVTRRGTKAMFTEALWGPESRAFAREWKGDGLDAALVDAVELKRVWARPKPDLRSVTPLQAAWLAANPPPAGPFPVPDSNQSRT